MDYVNNSGIKSPFSPRVRQSLSGRRQIGISSVKKTPSKFQAISGGPTGEVFYKTQLNNVESYGMPLPVLVTETLTYANIQVSVRFSSIGWCWLVCGRKLLVWQYRETKTPSRASASTCRELTLPQTDLAHKADLVCVFFNEGNQMPSCIGVSPEGVVRYWPSVAVEGAYVDESAELQGQECDRLTEPTSSGCVLATTTCTCVLVQTHEIDGRHVVETRTLRAPSGWLGGIGRRVSLLFFGSMPAQMMETKLVGIAVLESIPASLVEEGAAGAGGCGGGAGSCVAVVAGGPCLQVWRLAPAERLLHEAELRRPLCEAAHHSQLLLQADAAGLDVVVLDVRPSGSGLLLLVGAVNLTRSPEMRYALAQISVEENPLSRVTAFVPLQRKATFRDEPDSEALSLRFLNSGNRALLFNNKQLTIVSSTIPNDKPDVVDLTNDDGILGGELCFGVSILFTKKNGVVTVTSNEYAPDTSICESPIGSPCPSDMYDGHLSLYEIDPNEVSMLTTDACGKLKTAFLYHLRRDTTACRAIVDELFPSPSPPSPAPSPSRRAAHERAPPPDADVDAVLDRTVVRIATEMLDDVPAGDPRWTGQGSGLSTNIPLGSSAALQISTQLRDKQRALSLFIDFLRATGLWQRLGLISKERGGGVVSARATLAQLPERIACAGALRRLQQGAHAQLIDAAIRQVISSEELAEGCEEEEALKSGALTPSDVFYRRVTRVGRLFHAAGARCELQATSQARPDHVALLLLDANAVLLGALQEVHKCRTQTTSALATPGVRDLDPGPTWTGDLGPNGLAQVLAKQQRNTIVYGARAAQEGTLKGQLYDQAVSLAEYILTDTKYLTNSQHTIGQYERLRRKLIQPFVDDDQFDRMTLLAEKFKDFELLIVMCNKIKNMDRLYEFMEKYANEGLMEQTFAWMAEQGGPGSADLLQNMGKRYPDRLRTWLQATPDRRSLLAIHELLTERYYDAAAAYISLCLEETDSVERLNEMASTAKVCLYACDDHEMGTAQWDAAVILVDRLLTLCEHHRALPRDLLIRHGVDGERTLKVYTAGELVQMYCSTAEDSSLNEFDFKKALDLTDFIENEDEKMHLRLKVWCAAILHDDWRQYNADAPLDAVQEKTFFKLVDLTHLMGCDLMEYLPSVHEILAAPELAKLAQDKGFQYQLKYGYEFIEMPKSEDMQVR